MPGVPWLAEGSWHTPPSLIRPTPIVGQILVGELLGTSELRGAGGSVRVAPEGGRRRLGLGLGQGSSLETPAWWQDSASGSSRLPGPVVPVRSRCGEFGAPGPVLRRRGCTR